MKSAITAVLVLAASPALVADETSSFYASMLRRGVSDCARGAWGSAVGPLRIAAFGLVNDVPAYQTAQVYLTVASEKLGRAEEARAAAQKVLHAERVAPSTYATLQLDPTVKTAFETSLPKLVRPEQLALLPAFAPKKMAVAPAPVPVPVPAPVPMISVAPPPPAATTARQTTNAGEGAGAAPSTPKVAQVQPAPVPVPVPVPTPVPAPVKPQPQPQPPPQPPPTARTTTARPTPAPVRPAPAPAPLPVADSPMVAASRHRPSQSAAFADVSTRIKEAERLLNEGRILAARQIFIELAGSPALSRAQTLAIGRGLSATSAWRESSNVYRKAAPLRPGEEMHMFYEAVNLYELGDVIAARSLLQSAGPALPGTREVALYRARIEGRK